MADETPRYDTDGFEEITQAILYLVNTFPELESGDSIAYATLREDGGKSLQPLDGAVIQTEKKYIYGDVSQTCLYPFYLIYRVGRPTENRRAAIKEWLDKIGRWLDRQPVQVGGQTVQLSAYPLLSGSRRFLSFDRQLQSPAFLYATNENGTEDWAITLSAKYRYDYHL